MRIELEKCPTEVRLPKPGDLIYIQLGDRRVPLIATVSETVDDEDGTERWRTRALVDPEAQAGYEVNR